MQREKTIVLLKIVLLILALILVGTRIWVGEDAFISFRYIENFVHGNGLVYNLGERVEGFTHPLWIFLLAVFRFIGFELRPTAIFLGLFFSLTSIVLLLFLDSKKNMLLPVGVIFLISNSVFRDFATSGFETSLSFFLVTVLALIIKKHGLQQKPFQIGIVSSLLVVNRPETFLIFLYLLFYYCGILFFRKKPESVRFLQLPVIQFVIPFLLIVLPYQIFRMGYYGDLFPNTFHAKKGGALYLSQGIQYLRDVSISYSVHWIIAAGSILLMGIYRSGKHSEWVIGRIHLIVLAMVLAGYVLYTGGDYMHGRFLFMSLILIAIAFNDILEKVDFLGKSIRTQVAIIVVLLLLNIWQMPITSIFDKPLSKIKDERFHFLRSKNGLDWKYIAAPITGELGWAVRGYYFRELTEKMSIPISVNNGNIGLFGYAAGPAVTVVGSNLIDSYLARLPIDERGVSGHETHRWGDLHILFRKPSFSHTPYAQWNDSARFLYEPGKFSKYIERNDGNGSFIPVFDVSNQKFLNDFSLLVQKDVKGTIDTAQRNYIASASARKTESSVLTEREYFGFLEQFWVPYASREDQRLFFDAKKKLFPKNLVSQYEYFAEKLKSEAETFYNRTITPMTTSVFVNNFFRALKSPLQKDQRYDKKSHITLSRRDVTMISSLFESGQVRTNNISFSNEFNVFHVGNPENPGVIQLQIPKSGAGNAHYYLKIIYAPFTEDSSLIVSTPGETEPKQLFLLEGARSRELNEFREIWLDVAGTIMITIGNGGNSKNYGSVIKSIEVL